jgi:hypothetical protein
MKGWNFVAANPEMQGKTMQDIKGDCDILWAYGFGKESASSAQSWLPFGNNTFNAGFIGQGLIIKVSDNCKLGDIIGGVNDNVNPPQLPVSGCSDSDGGLDYNVKGTVSAPDEAGTDECCTLIGEGGHTCPGNGNSLHEWYCDINTLGEDQFYECPNGCSDGACVQSIQNEIIK